jgi:hypothetical protein
MTIKCEDCETSIDVNGPDFNTTNLSDVSIISWAHPVVKCRCGSEYVGAIVALQPAIALTYFKKPKTEDKRIIIPGQA